MSFGLESASPRVVALMQKGHTCEVAQTVLDTCFRHDVLVQYHVMFGFPTETSEEAAQTISFLEKNQERIACIRVNSWHLELASPIGREPEKYGVFPTSSDLRTYRLQEGIDKEMAEKFVGLVSRHPLLGQKMVSDLKTEPFFVAELLLTR